MNTTYSSRVRAPNSSLDGSSSDDPAPLNCLQRGSVDDSAVRKRSRKTQIFKKINKKISRPFFISTYNVRSLHEGWKQHELVAKAFEFDIPVIAIQEHRIKNKPTLVIDGYKFLLSPPKDRRILGVGFLLSPWAQRCYIEHNFFLIASCSSCSPVMSKLMSSPFPAGGLPSLQGRWQEASVKPSCPLCPLSAPHVPFHPIFFPISSAAELRFSPWTLTLESPYSSTLYFIPLNDECWTRC